MEYFMTLWLLIGNTHSILNSYSASEELNKVIYLFQRSEHCLRKCFPVCCLSDMLTDSGL